MAPKTKRTSTALPSAAPSSSSGIVLAVGQSLTGTGQLGVKRVDTSAIGVTAPPNMTVPCLNLSGIVSGRRIAITISLRQDSEQRISQYAAANSSYTFQRISDFYGTLSWNTTTHLQCSITPFFVAEKGMVEIGGSTFSSHQQSSLSNAAPARHTPSPSGSQTFAFTSSSKLSDGDNILLTSGRWESAQIATTFAAPRKFKFSMSDNALILCNQTSTLKYKFHLSVHSRNELANLGNYGSGPRTPEIMGISSFRIRSIGRKGKVELQCWSDKLNQPSPTYSFVWSDRMASYIEEVIIHTNLIA